MRFGSLLDQIAVDLNDAAPGHEFTTWSREQLGAYLEEAIQLAFTERPDLFTETRIIKVQPCSEIQESCDCTQIRRVVGQVTKTGGLIKHLRIKKHGSDRLVWTGRSCSVHPKNFQLQEYYIDSVTDKLWVYPIVPAGVDVYIMIECAVLPSEFGEGYEVHNELRAAVIQWVLFRAKMVDGENNTAIVSVANHHKNTFWELLRVSANNVVETRGGTSTNAE